MAKKLPKLVVMGYGRHGKDATSQMLCDMYGYTYVSSSEFAGREGVFPLTQSSNACGEQSNLAQLHRVPEYATFEECYADRHNHRAFWFEAISRYNAEPARLGREIFQKYTLYCGLRSAREFRALRAARLFDFAIWVDASKRHPAEDALSCSVRASMADFTIKNSGDLFDLSWEVRRVMSMLGMTTTREMADA